jgi:hypothetical protein
MCDVVAGMLRGYFVEAILAHAALLRDKITGGGAYSGIGHTTPNKLSSEERYN